MALSKISLSSIKPSPLKGKKINKMSILEAWTNDPILISKKQKTYQNYTQEYHHFDLPKFCCA